MPISKKLSLLLKYAFMVALVGMSTMLTAQEEQTAELKVEIKDVITFTLSDANPTLVFDEATDFINGVSYTASLAGTITASGSFSLSVKAEKNDLESSAGDKIQVSSVSVEPTGSAIGTTSKVALSTSEQDIISGAPAAISKTFGLTYTTAGNDTEFIGKPAGDYTVNLVYIATLD